MIVKSKIEGLQDWLFIEDIPDVCFPNSPLNEKKTTIERFPIHMSNYQLSTGGLFILYSEMSFQGPVRIHTEVEGETVTSQFVFYKGIDNKKVKTSFHGRGRHNVRYIPSFVEDYELKSGTEYDYFLVVLSKDFYFKLIAPESVLHEDFVQKINKGEFTSFSHDDMFVTHEMLKVIAELKDNKRTGELRRIHTESKISELLVYQLEQLNDSFTEEKDHLLGDDIVKLLNARSILDERYAQAPTQKTLAEEVGMSESKLRQSFKEYFSVTIYDYLTRVRMEKARSLLLDEGKSIAEVAALTGYNHQQNFSVAFKKYYGIAPSDIK